MIMTAIPGLPSFDAPDDVWCMAEEYRRPYVKVKYSVAEELRPLRICEIGVYSGIAALCFLAASPTAEYFGIDNLSAERGRGISVVRETERLLDSLGYNVTVQIADSQSLPALSCMFDFIHVDGDHSRAAARHDVSLAWRALSHDGHILIDNAHDASVCAGTFDALAECTAGLLDWRYIAEGVGSILIRRAA